MNIKMLKVALACLVLSVSGFANSALIVTSGDDSAVLTEDYTVNFDALLSGQDLTSYTEGGLVFSAFQAGSTNNCSAINCVGFHSGFVGMSGQILYNLSKGMSVTASDGSDFIAMEIMLGTGYIGSSLMHVVWETLLDGLTTGTGTFEAPAGHILGLYDESKFDTLKIGTFQTGSTNADFSGSGASAFDNVSAQSAIRAVPEPSTLAIFTLGIMGLASRRFKKQ